MEQEELVRVYSTGSITDGYLAKGRLEAEGIPVLIKGEGEGPYRMGPVYLWVPSGLEVQARQILNEIAAGGAGTEPEEELSEDELAGDDSPGDDASTEP